MLIDIQSFFFFECFNDGNGDRNDYLLVAFYSNLVKVQKPEKN